MKLKISISLLVFLIIFFQSCSLNKIAANQTASIIIKAMPAFERETDLELAEQAIAGNLKLLEGLLETTPKNPELLLVTSSSFAQYAFGFIECQIDKANFENDYVEKEKQIARAVNFYNRSKQYALRLILKSHRNFAVVLKLSLDKFSEELQHFNQSDTSALFWMAYAWGSIINLEQNKPEHLSDLPKVELMMRRVMQLNENFYFDGPHLFLGAYYGNRPKMVGGDADKAKENFSKAIQHSEGKYLIAKFLTAKYYYLPTQNRQLFESTLKEILSAPSDIFPELSLANQIAKRNAALWLEHIDELFY